MPTIRCGLLGCVYNKILEDEELGVCTKEVVVYKTPKEELAHCHSISLFTEEGA